jgi:hypothetical protein
MLDLRPGGPNGRFGFNGKENIAAPAGNKSLVLQLVAKVSRCVSVFNMATFHDLANVETGESNQFPRPTLYLSEQLGLGWFLPRRKQKTAATM